MPLTTRSSCVNHLQRGTAFRLSNPSSLQAGLELTPAHDDDCENVEVVWVTVVAKEGKHLELEGESLLMM